MLPSIAAHLATGLIVFGLAYLDSTVRRASARAPSASDDETAHS